MHVRDALRHHWFIPAAACIGATSMLCAATTSWPQEARWIEAALLFDLAVVLPLLYVACYRLRHRGWQWRAFGVASAGVWFAWWLVPSQHHALLEWLSWLRPVVMIPIIYLEARIIVSLYWAVMVRGEPSEDTAARVARDTGLPIRITRLLAREAAFWRRIATAIRAYRTRAGRD